MTSKLSDQWQTPQWLFDELSGEFNFDIDLCATKENSKCILFGTDYLRDGVGSVHNDMDYPCFQEYIKENLLSNGTCFMNPPYSNPRPFIEKAWEDSKHCKIVCLVKCDPSTKWWATFWNYGEIWTKDSSYSDAFKTGLTHLQRIGPKQGCEVRFFPKRIKFGPPKGFEGRTTGPCFPSALIIMDRRGL